MLPPEARTKTGDFGASPGDFPENAGGYAFDRRERRILPRFGGLLPPAFLATSPPWPHRRTPVVPAMSAASSILTCAKTARRNRKSS